MWFEPGDTCAGVRSALGSVNGVLPVTLVDGHCASRTQCTIVQFHPGRLVVLPCAMLQQLKSSGHARWHGDRTEVRVSLAMDHTCTGEPMTLEFLVMPVRWRDRPDRTDSDLVLGVSPELPLRPR
ncbi:hypothetical protein MMUR_02130 [Mycolicibacterium murale]|uniref:Uncharacterized protein n=1 Tax=Mycolicibacterium murale TaxID=182220 RepID=A0A7I9WFL6_9MYCO|nr:hypothetical protein [Mycolicibacterium murale]MCV7182251.1 hypothetical protein [Mycolicibacterium murale]GFG56077.1 hypothetical protein MMUR_02130 [Mycolicibacterium murale]